GLAGGTLVHLEALGLGGFLVPVAEAVAAEASKVHQVEVLHVGALAQMLDQPAEGGGFELGTGTVIHGLDPQSIAIGTIYCGPVPAQLAGQRSATVSWTSQSMTALSASALEAPPAIALAY